MDAKESQAAQGEQEAVECTCHYLAPRDCPHIPHRTCPDERNPSACEVDGWRIEVRPDNRDGVLGVWATKDGVSYWLAAASHDAALQHRGDSRGGEG